MHLFRYVNVRTGCGRVRALFLPVYRIPGAVYRYKKYLLFIAWARPAATSSKLMKPFSRNTPSPAPAAPSTGPYHWTPPLTDTSPPAPPNPNGRLVILKQNCLTEEKFVRNGEPCNVRIVVKNSPFVVQVGYVHILKLFYLFIHCAFIFSYEPTTIPPVPVDFKSMVFDARLIYDTPDEKEVDFIKLKPLDTKISVNEVLFVRSDGIPSLTADQPSGWHLYELRGSPQSPHFTTRR